jgi:hypothetical protein
MNTFYRIRITVFISARRSALSLGGLPVIGLSRKPRMHSVLYALCILQTMVFVTPTIAAVSSHVLPDRKR